MQEEREPIGTRESLRTAAEPSARRLPGFEGLWVFIAADMAIFAVLFLSFMQERFKQPEVFEASRRLLNPDFGGVNTLILLSSSWFVVMAVQAIRERRASPSAPLWLAAAFACGLAFGMSKAFEYGGKLAAGITPVTDGFFMFYYVLTGIHLLHVIAGTVVLAWMWRRACRGDYLPEAHVGLESGACYWHMVDLLWIVLFPLLYLMR